MNTAIALLGVLVAAQTPVQPQAQVGSAHARSGTVKPISTAGLKAVPFTTAAGRPGWRIKVPGGRALATPAVVDGVVFVGGGFGSHEFYAFEALTGAPRWAIQVSDDGPTAAVVADGRVVFNTESCTLFVVDAKTGKQLWSRWLGDPLMSQPAVHAGVIYMAYPGPGGGHRLIALRLETGERVFERPIAGDVVSAPIVDGDSLYLTTTNGTVYRFALPDGRLLFEKDMHATSAPFISGGEVHVAQGDGPAAHGRSKSEGFRTLSGRGEFRGEVQAQKEAPYLDPEVQDRSSYSAKQAHDDASVGFGSGAPAAAKTSAAKANLGQGTVRGLWEFQGSRPTIIGTRNFTTQGDAVRALDKANGKLLWERKLAGDVRRLGGHLGSPPAYAKGKLVVATALGDVVAFDAEHGQELFRVALGEEVRFQPALAAGRIYVGTAAGTLVAIDSGHGDLDGWTMWGGGPAHNGPESR